MSDDLKAFVQELQPSSTILLFGAGSSLPSHAPSVQKIIEHLSKAFNQASDGFSLAELTDLIEQKTKNRQRMIEELRRLFINKKPTGGLLNIPLYDWKAIYTTNYDVLIEDAYKLKEKGLKVYSCNFDFQVVSTTACSRLYKLHGTIDKDVSDGHHSRLILTGNDYSFTGDYRDFLYGRLAADLAESNLVIIGHSLADPDIKEIVDKAIVLNKQACSGGRITLLMYSPDEDRALLYRSKGLRVVFGGIDDFFTNLSTKAPDYVVVSKTSDDPLEKCPALNPVTIDVSYELNNASADVSRMFNGWPATYQDVVTNLTFERSVADAVKLFLDDAEKLCAVIVGASGVGKTTAARQAVNLLRQSG